MQGQYSRTQSHSRALPHHGHCLGAAQHKKKGEHTDKDRFRSAHKCMVSQRVQHVLGGTTAHACPTVAMCTMPVPALGQYCASSLTSHAVPVQTHVSPQQTSNSRPVHPARPAPLLRLAWGRESHQLVTHSGGTSCAATKHQLPLQGCSSHRHGSHPNIVTLQHEQPCPLYEFRVLLSCHEPLHHSVGPVLHRELTPGVTLRLQRVRTERGELQT